MGMLNSIKVLRNDATWKLFLVAALLTAAPVVFLHTSLYHSGLDSDYVQKLTAFHEGIIRGEGFSPFQYRFAAYWIPEVLSRGGIPLHYAYTLNRFIWTYTGVLTLFALLRQWFGRNLATWGGLVYLVLLPITYFNGQLQPSDAPLFVFFVLGYLCLAVDRLEYIPAIVLFGAFFHETIFWLIPLAGLYVLLFRRSTRSILIIVATAAAWLMAYFGIRAAVGPREVLTESFQLLHNAGNVWAYINTFIMIGPFVLLNRKVWAQLAPAVQVALLTTPIIVMIIWLFARPSEARLFIVLIPAAASLVLTALGEFSDG